MHSLLLCIEETKNNSAKRRRPVAYAEANATESNHNIKTLLSPYISEVKLLKDNCSVLVIQKGDEYRCCVLTCNIDQKYELDDMWRVRNNLSYFHQPKSAKEAETCKRQSNRNLVNYNCEKLFAFEGKHTSDSVRLSQEIYSQLFICCHGTESVDIIYIRQHVGNGEYKEIGQGRFWGGLVSLDELQTVNVNSQCKYIAFNPNMTLLRVCDMDSADLSGFDKRFGFGNHSCTYFCVCCKVDGYTKLQGDNIAYRTPSSINSNALKYYQAETG